MRDKGATRKCGTETAILLARLIAASASKLFRANSAIERRDGHIDVRGLGLQAADEQREQHTDARARDKWDLHNEYEKVLVNECYERLRGKWSSRLADTETYLQDNCWAMLNALTVQLPAPDF